MKPTKLQLMLNISYVEHEREFYFVVSEIKEKYEDLKFPPDKIIQLPFQGMLVNMIKERDIQEMTEFDKKVIQFLKYKK